MSKAGFDQAIPTLDPLSQLNIWECDSAREGVAFPSSHWGAPDGKLHLTEAHGLHTWGNSKPTTESGSCVGKKRSSLWLFTLVCSLQLLFFVPFFNTSNLFHFLTYVILWYVMTTVYLVFLISSTELLRLLKSPKWWEHKDIFVNEVTFEAPKDGGQSQKNHPCD